MGFRLWTILWVFALLASAMATFGVGAIFIVPIVIWLWAIALNKPRSMLVNWLIGFAFLGVFAALLLPAISSARGAARRSACLNNTKQIALALVNYESLHGSLPPAYIADSDGKPMHSWRVLVLPLLGHKALFDRYSLDEPWNGPNNRKLWDEMPAVFRCPSCAAAVDHGVLNHPLHATNYYAVVGPGTLWPGTSSAKLSSISNVASETLMLLESVNPTCWMEPSDISLEEAEQQLSTSANNGHLSVNVGFITVTTESCGKHAAFADGYARYLHNFLSQELAQLLLSADGKKISAAQISTSHEAHLEAHDVITNVRWARVYSLSTFVLLSLMPAYKLVGRSQKSAANTIVDGGA